MSKLTLDEAIKHCLEVAEENDLAAGMYEILAENNHNAYGRLTAETNSSRCAERAAEHRQLAEWLTELKELREEYREVVMEGEILNADYTEQVALNEQYNKRQVALNEQYKKREEQYKRLLKAAVEDIHELLCDKKNLDGNGQSCNICSHIEWCPCCKECTIREDLRNWRYADEALKLIGGSENG